MNWSKAVSLLALSALCGCASSSPRGRPSVAPPPPGGPAGNTVHEGVDLYRQGRYAEAEAVLAATPGPQARAYLAASRVRLGKYAEAETPALEALAADPADPVASAALGESLVSQGRLDDAVSHLTAVIQANASLPYAYYWRGQAYQRKKQVARMADDYQTFLRLAPDAPEAPAVRVLLGGLH